MGLRFSSGICAFALLSPSLFSGPAVASGFYLQEQSARGLGRANSGEVADWGAASLWWNPASIGGMRGMTATLGATYIQPSGRIIDAGSTIDGPVGGPMPVGGAAIQRNPVQKGLLPSAAVGLALDARWALGLAITAPYSFTTEYDDDGWTRYSALTSDLKTFDIQPSIAFSPSPEISIGLALNAEHAQATLTNASPNILPGSPDGHVALGGEGWDFGWSAGVQFRPSSRLSLGFSYKSSVEHRLEGEAVVERLAGPLAAGNGSNEVTARFSTPWQLSGGMRWQATERLTLNAQVTRFGWSEFDAIRIGPPLDRELRQDYHDTTSLAGGIDYQAAPALTLRAGIQADESPTPEAGEPRVPDADRMMYTAGGSYRVNDRITLDAAAAYVDLAPGRISQSDSFYEGTHAQTLISLEGTTSDQKVLMASVGARLSF